MKSSLRILALTLAALCLGTATLNAEKDKPTILTPNVSDVNAGQLNIELSQALTSTSFSSKVYWSFHGTHATSNPSIRGLRVFAGQVDTTTGQGEFTSVGYIEAIGPTMAVELRHITLDTTGGTGVITAEVLVNGTMSGRIPVFTLVSSGNFTTPFTGSTFQTPTVGFAVSDSFAALFNTVFGQPILSNGLAGGSISATATIGSIAK